MSGWTLNAGFDSIKVMVKAPKAETVDNYIASAPKEVQGKLKEIRKAIREAAPGADERISYGMPYYHYKGRLAYFSYWKNHIGLYLPTPIVADHHDELKGYKTTKATVQFPLDKNLPVALVKKLVRARIKKSEAPKKLKLIIK